MTNPFVVSDDDIEDRTLRDSPSRRWIEETLPSAGDEIEYLKPALRSARLRWGLLAVFCLLFLLLARSAELQIFKKTEYRSAAERNRLRIMRLQAPRGAIVDRTGQALTVNVPRFELVLNPLDLPPDPGARREILQKVSLLTELSVDALEESTRIRQLPVVPISLRTNLTLEAVYPLFIAAQDIPGVTVETIALRTYPLGEAFSQVLGYLGKIDAAEKETYLRRGYRLNDAVGKTGLEAKYEDFLRGQAGRTHLEVDAAGHAQKVIAQEAATSGGTLRLSLDAQLQVQSAEILKGQLQRLHKGRGAVIVLDPQNGEIRALVSLPTFDNNLFNTLARDPEALQAVFENLDQPLFSRAISGTYPSGSTIKPAIAAAALTEKLITVATTYLSSGGLRIGQWFFPDWKAGGHGSTDVRRAIAESVNTFFYIIGGGYDHTPGLGVERLAKYLQEFGFGKPSGIELPGEAAGFVPTPQWKTDKKGEPWYIGDTYHLAIGQGDFLVTPIQIARMAAYFAAEGKWTPPHLVLEPPLYLPLTKGEIAGVGPSIDSQHIQTVRQGMRDAVLYGSARLLADLPFTSAGKTGTAEWSDTQAPHAWFAGWAPYSDPEIVVTVIIEEGGEGSSAALPVAKEIMRWWYENRAAKNST